MEKYIWVFGLIFFVVLSSSCCSKIENAEKTEESVVAYSDVATPDASAAGDESDLVYETYSGDEIVLSADTLTDVGGVIGVEDINLAGSSVCIVTAPDQKGWKLKKEQKISVEYLLEHGISIEDAQLYIGLIQDGEKKSPILFEGTSGNPLFVVPDEGEYCIYIENPLTADMWLEKVCIALED